MELSRWLSFILSFFLAFCLISELIEAEDIFCNPTAIEDYNTQSNATGD